MLRFKDNKASDLRIVVPGEVIVEKTKNFMGGSGTYESEDKIISSIVGKVSILSKLVTVIPVKSPYSPETGDVIIGRIISVEKRYWKVNIWAQREVTLNLAQINLPGGEQRKRGEEDANQMRMYFKENDLLSGEVLPKNQSGSLNIQTRNLKFGKLKNGILVKVDHKLIIRMKKHFFDLINDIKIILGMNGAIWIYFSTVKVDDEYFTDDKTKSELIGKDEKPNEENCRYIILFKNIVTLLNCYNIIINRDTIMRCYDLLMDYRNKLNKNDNNNNNDNDTKVICPKISNEEENIIIPILKKEISNNNNIKK